MSFNKTVLWHACEVKPGQVEKISYAITFALAGHFHSEGGYYWSVTYAWQCSLNTYMISSVLQLRQTLDLLHLFGKLYGLTHASSSSFLN